MTPGYSAANGNGDAKSSEHNSLMMHASTRRASPYCTTRGAHLRTSTWTWHAMAPPLAFGHWRSTPSVQIRPSAAAPTHHARYAGPARMPPPLRHPARAPHPCRITVAAAHPSDHRRHNHTKHGCAATTTKRFPASVACSALHDLDRHACDSSATPASLFPPTAAIARPAAGIWCSGWLAWEAPTPASSPPALPSPPAATAPSPS
eukprot:scaffold33319_cov152-Isochrysis_galbana.AAC.2